jgi:hypothetical protein
VELTTDQKGAIAEAVIAAAALKLGVGVFRPVSDGHRYDLIFDLGPELVRVQCKCAVLGDSVLAIPCYSARRDGNGYLKRPYGEGEIDAIAAYARISIGAFSFRSPRYRVEPAYSFDSRDVETTSSSALTGLTHSRSRLD